MIKDYRQLDLWNKKVFEKAVVEPPFRVFAEMPNEACFYFVSSGEANAYTPGGKVHMATNEGLVLKCGNYFNEFLRTTEGEYCEAIAIHFYPEVLKMIYEREFPDFLKDVQQITPVRSDKVKSSRLLNQYIESLQFYFENPELVSEELLKLKLKELILLLAKTDNADTIKSLIAGLFDDTEIDFKEVIEANLYHNLSLEELASLTSMSLSSFKREFVKLYDSSPGRYIRKRRLQRAAKLLQVTQLRVSDIAFDCGFNDLANFSKSFLKDYGVSPSEYRASVGPVP